MHAGDCNGANRSFIDGADYTGNPATGWPRYAVAWAVAQRRWAPAGQLTPSSRRRKASLSCRRDLRPRGTPGETWSETGPSMIASGQGQVVWPRNTVLSPEGYSLALPGPESCQQLVLGWRSDRLFGQSAQDPDRLPHLFQVDGAAGAAGDMLLETLAFGRRELPFQIVRHQLDQLLASQVLRRSHLSPSFRTSTRA